MKKIAIGILSLLLVFLSVGCYGNNYSKRLINNSRISEAELDSFFYYPNDYIGREIEITGVVIGDPIYRNGKTNFKIKVECAVHAQTLSIDYSGWIETNDYSEITESDTVDVMGYVAKKTSFSSNPYTLINAYSVSVSSLKSTGKEVILNETQVQAGLSITLEKAVFSKEGVTTYFSATNTSTFPILLQDSNVNFIQNGISYLNNDWNHNISIDNTKRFPIGYYTIIR